MLLSSEAEWVRDGHHLWMEINHSELVITAVQCPNESSGEGLCLHPRHGCMVRWFVNLYGLECNVGTCEPEGHLEFAWALMGETHDLDLAQLWIIPVKDSVFASFFAPPPIIDVE